MNDEVQHEIDSLGCAVSIVFFSLLILIGAFRLQAGRRMDGLADRICRLEYPHCIVETKP